MHLDRIRHRLATAAAVAAVALGGCSAATISGAPSSTAPTAPAPSTAVASTPPTASPSPTATPEPSPSAPPRNPAALTGMEPYVQVIDPAAFATVIDNPYQPWVPGTRFTYEGAGQRIEVEVTDQTRTILGVPTVVVRDQVFEGKKLIEDTFDWYAQDKQGNVWYFGEATTSFETDPAGDHAGSWEAGVDGAQPGIVMLADPQVGDTYRQEFLAGEAEDLALVRDLTASIKVAYGTFDDVLVTEEWTPLTPNEIEHKFYARGVGLVGERVVAGGKEKIDLVAVRPPGS
jgi:hypothetical protein